MMLHIENLSLFQNFKKFSKTGHKDVTKNLKNARKVKLQALQLTSRHMLSEHLSKAAPEISDCFL